MIKELDWDALHAAVEAGYAANAAMADFYDSLTPDEVDQVFDDGVEVQVRSVPRKDQRVTYGLSFSRDEMLALRKAAGDEATHEWMKATLLRAARIDRALKRNRATLDRLADAEPHAMQWSHDAPWGIAGDPP